jgi:hypothetical protein
MAARSADGYFFPEHEAAARKRVRIAAVTDGILLQVILIKRYF